LKTYKVKRSHQGDKWYPENSMRVADPSVVSHLVERGILEEKKAAEPPKNKAVKAAPRNKAHRAKSDKKRN